MGRGLVSIVGAGPGDPALLTRKAADRLARADVVFYDALVAPEVLALAPRARCVPVGKRAGRHTVSQTRLHRLLVQAARRGARVVRLKGGDPFVFGRGGEEALALKLAGVPVEVVPGVSAAVAAPALAGIPVTHRGLASGFLVVSGHAEARFGPVVDAVPPGTVTLVVLMGLRTRHALASRLLARGWPPAMPAAAVLDASTPRQRVWTGTLGALAAAPIGSDPETTGTLVIGPVVALARILADVGAGAPDDEAADAGRGAGWCAGAA
jgi:uroporphyrin-III C-methyltransferase